MVNKTNIVEFLEWQVIKTLKKGLVKRVGDDWVTHKEVVFKSNEDNHAEYEILCALRSYLEGRYVTKAPFMQKDGTMMPGIDGVINVSEENLQNKMVCFRFWIEVERCYV